MMTEEEMLIRAREAYITAAGYSETSVFACRIREGHHDLGEAVSTALHALRNLDKPVELPRPADEVAAYEIYENFGSYCWENRELSLEYRSVLGAVRAGIALAKEGKV